MSKLLIGLLMLLLFGASCGSAAENDQSSADSTPSDEASTSTEASTSATEPVADSDAEPGADSDASDSDDADSDDGAGLFPDVVGVDAVQAGDGTWTFSVTLSSPYDTPERYADAWRVAGSDGEVFAIRELTHDHQSEQPFTRSQDGIVIPEEVQSVVIEGRDQLSGWGGDTIDFQLER